MTTLMIFCLVDQNPTLREWLEMCVVEDMDGFCPNVSSAIVTLVAEQM